MNHKIALLIASWIVLPHLARGDDFAGDDFSLRFPAALSNFSVYADVAAKGGASAASKFGSSINPAAMAWSFPEDYDYGASVQYSNVAFHNNMRLSFLSEALTLDARDFGTIRFSFGEVSNTDRTIRASPLTFTYDLAVGRADWAKRWGDWAVGADFSYGESDTSFRTSKLVFVDAERDTSLGQIGLQWQPTPKGKTDSRWLFGLVGEFGDAPTHTDFLTPTAQGVFKSEADDITRQVVARPGIAYQWGKNPNALLQLDYQAGGFWNRTGSLRINHFSIGGDFPLAEFLFLRAGGVVNTRSDFGWTAGVGFYPHEGVFFDVAYQNDVFPELQREFGHSRTLNISVCAQF